MRTRNPAHWSPATGIPTTNTNKHNKTLNVVWCPVCLIMNFRSAKNATIEKTNREKL